MTLREVGDEMLRIAEANSGVITNAGFNDFIKLHASAFQEFFSKTSVAQVPFIIAIMRVVLERFEADAGEDALTTAKHVEETISVARVNINGGGDA